jgi:hypothetical protein
MNVIERLKNHIKRNNIKLPKVVEDTGIPYHRMHKWLSGEGNPKAEDSKILEDYLAGTLRRTSNITEEPEKEYATKAEDFMKMLDRTLTIIESQQEVIKGQQATIQEIVTNKKTPASA